MSCRVCAEPWSSPQDDMTKEEYREYRAGLGCPCCRSHRVYCPDMCGAINDLVAMVDWVQGVVGEARVNCKCGQRMLTMAELRERDLA